MRFLHFGTCSVLLVALACGGSPSTSPSPPSNPAPTPTLTGAWRGSWSSSLRGSGGSMTATLVQTGTNAVCGFGACSASVGNSPCFSSTNYIYGTVSGASFSLEFLFHTPGYRDEESPRLRFTGVMNASGASASGQYVALNGPQGGPPSPCAGDTGTWVAQKQ